MGPNEPVGPVVPVRPTELLMPLHGPNDDAAEQDPPPPLMGCGCNNLLCAAIIVLFLLELHCDILLDISLCIWRNFTNLV